MLLTKDLLYEISRSKKTVGFGAGHIAVKTLNILEDCFDYYVDNDERKWGTNFKEKSVLPPETILTEDKESIYIVICTEQHRAVAKQLSDMGFVEGIHFGYSILLKSIMAFEKLDTGSTKLLVSSYGSDSGLFTVDTRTNRVERLQKGQFRGIVRFDDSLWIVDEYDAIWCLDASALSVKWKRPVSGLVKPCGITHCPERHRVYLANTGKDEILVFDEEGTRLDTIFISQRNGSRKGEQHHVNDIIVRDDKLLVSMFSRSGYWRNNIFDGSLVEFDLETKKIGRELMGGLTKPHSVSVREETIYLLDSFTGTLLAGTTPIAQFNGFARGLEKDNHRFYIGQSKNRHIENLNKSQTTTMVNSGILVYLQEERIYKFIDMSFTSDIYGILDLARDGV